MCILIKISRNWLKIFSAIKFKKFDIASIVLFLAVFLDLTKFSFFNFINFLLYLPSLLLSLLLLAFPLLLTLIPQLLLMILLSDNLVLSIEISRASLLLKS